jgi:hypothetical protein
MGDGLGPRATCNTRFSQPCLPARRDQTPALEQFPLGATRRPNRLSVVGLESGCTRAIAAPARMLRLQALIPAVANGRSHIKEHYAELPSDHLVFTVLLANRHAGDGSCVRPDARGQPQVQIPCLAVISFGSMSV